MTVNFDFRKLCCTPAGIAGNTDTHIARAGFPEARIGGVAAGRIKGVTLCPGHGHKVAAVFAGENRDGLVAGLPGGIRWQFHCQLIDKVRAAEIDGGRLRQGTGAFPVGRRVAVNQVAGGQVAHGAGAGGCACIDRVTARCCSPTTAATTTGATRTTTGAAGTATAAAAATGTRLWVNFKF